MTKFKPIQIKANLIKEIKNNQKIIAMRKANIHIVQDIKVLTDKCDCFLNLLSLIFLILLFRC